MTWFINSSNHSCNNLLPLRIMKRVEAEQSFLKVPGKIMEYVNQSWIMSEWTRNVTKKNCIPVFLSTICALKSCAPYAILFFNLPPRKFLQEESQTISCNPQCHRSILKSWWQLPIYPNYSKLASSQTVWCSCDMIRVLAQCHHSQITRDAICWE